MKIEFCKYQGTGNDFVIIDNRIGTVELTNEIVKHLCDRRFGIGADGLMLLNTKIGYDFEMIYYNSDGHVGSMCGNGGRCITQFAYDIGIHKDSYHFIAVDGAHESTFGDHEWIHLKMKDVTTLETHFGNFIVDTGSPHFIKSVMDIWNVNVFEEGKEIRYSKDFFQEGINVNFVESSNRKIIVRTYERGVEDETYSCGTGVTASALVFAHNENGFNRIDVQTKGGHLAVEFDKTSEQSFENIWLCGPALFVFKGVTEV